MTTLLTDVTPPRGCLRVLLTVVGLLAYTQLTESVYRILDIHDISARNVRIGKLSPGNPAAVIGRTFVMNCTIERRKLFHSLGFHVRDIFFMFDLTDDRRVIVRGDDVTNVSQSTVQLRYNVTDVGFHYADIKCLARINGSAALNIDDQLMYAGYPPAEGVIKGIKTDDLRTIRVTYNKSHANPSYPTRFVLYCKFSEFSEFSLCPNAVELSNDTIEFSPILTPGEKFLDNRNRISIRLNSSSVHGGWVFGPITEFDVYAKYKPVMISELKVFYEQGQTAVVTWKYPLEAPLALKYIISYESNWDTKPIILQHQASYRQSGPFNLTLNGLHWGTSYNVSIYAEPIPEGYKGDESEISFTTEENVPAANPVVTPGGYERVVQNGSQTVVLYWQPVPPELTNGVITKTRLEIIKDGKISYQTVDQTEAKLDQAHIYDLALDSTYLCAVKVENSKGYAEISNFIMIVPHKKALPPPDNLTVVADTDPNGRETVVLSWNYDISPESDIYVHWCFGSANYFCKGTQYQKLLTDGTSRHVFTDLKTSEYKFGISVVTNTSNSGIIWAKCTHDRKEAAGKPQQARDAETTHRSVMLYVIPGRCAAKQGLTYKYLVTVCSVCDGDDIRHVEFPRSVESAYLVEGMRANTQYNITVHAISVGGISEPLYISIHTATFNVIIIALSVTGTVLGFSIIVFVAVCCKRCEDWFSKKQKVELPVSQELERQVADGGPEEFKSYETHVKLEAPPKIPPRTDIKQSRNSPMLVHSIDIALFVTNCGSSGDYSEEEAETALHCGGGDGYNNCGRLKQVLQPEPDKIIDHRTVQENLIPRTDSGDLQTTFGRVSPDGESAAGSMLPSMLPSTQPSGKLLPPRTLEKINSKMPGKNDDMNTSSIGKCSKNLITEDVSTVMDKTKAQNSQDLDKSIDPEPDIDGYSQIINTTNSSGNIVDEPCQDMDQTVLTRIQSPVDHVSSIPDIHTAETSSGQTSIIAGHRHSNLREGQPSGSESNDLNFFPHLDRGTIITQSDTTLIDTDMDTIIAQPDPARLDTDTDTIIGKPNYSSRKKKTCVPHSNISTEMLTQGASSLLNMKQFSHGLCDDEEDDDDDDNEDSISLLIHPCTTSSGVTDIPRLDGARLLPTNFDDDESSYDDDDEEEEEDSLYAGGRTIDDIYKTASAMS